MRRHRTLALVVLLLLVGLFAAAFVSLRRAYVQSEPVRPTVDIPEVYRSVRASAGHREHLEAHVRCAQCHELSHGKFAIAEPAALCVRCHKNIQQPLHHPDHDHQAPACLGCHAFGPVADGGTATVATDCMRCHDRGFGSDVPAVERHADVRCLECHAPHASPALHVASCLRCHPGMEARHGGSELPGAQQCLMCHGPHQTKPTAAERCAGCHASRSPKVPPSATFPGHDGCVSCHAGHVFDKTSVRSCRDCHANVHVLAEDTAASHSRCRSCHAPHAVKGSAAASCTRCHGSVSSDHPNVRGRCAGCHVPHPSRAAAPGTRSEVVACTSCHHEASSDTALHAGGIDCVRCHRPHHFVIDVADTKLCAGCHPRQSSETMTLAGHQPCTECHRQAAHRPSAPARACGDCHRAQLATAPAGHLGCVQCHQPHNGQLTAAGHDCGSCHVREPQSLHARSGAACTLCHRPHGPQGPAQPPACQSCHAISRLVGLHAIRAHQQCSQCHSPHEHAPSSRRATCARCHRGTEQHQPQATVCNGCHVFG